MKKHLLIFLIAIAGTFAANAGNGAGPAAVFIKNNGTETAFKINSVSWGDASVEAINNAIPLQGQNFGTPESLVFTYAQGAAWSDWNNNETCWKCEDLKDNFKVFYRLKNNDTASGWAGFMLSSVNSGTFIEGNNYWCYTEYDAVNKDLLQEAFNLAGAGIYTLETALEYSDNSSAITEPQAANIRSAIFTIPEPPKFPAVNFTTLTDGHLIVSGTSDIDITAQADELCNWILQINSSQVQQATSQLQVSYIWTPLQEGNYIIYAAATNADGNTATKEITVQVVQASEIPAPAISFITPKNNTVYTLGQSVEVNVSAQYTDSLFFYADNVLLSAGDVTENKITITPQTTGSRRIEIIARNNARKQSTAFINITVIDEPYVKLRLADTGVNNAKISVNIETSNADSLFLSAILGSDTTQHFAGIAPDLMTYTFNNLAEGVYTILAAAKNIYGQSAQDVLPDVQVTVTAIENMQGSGNLKIYPNPVSAGGILNIESVVDGDYFLYSPIGRKMMNGTLGAGRTVSIVGLQAGIYILRVSGTAYKIIVR
ncbi:MAG: T9SS type A sorting domain-containing protein [Bacteroidales bacterium]|jgi:hypothetical protein|nr:T9SS type A sorting domain-containing protein [Bacteroidales bacterium]